MYRTAWRKRQINVLPVTAARIQQGARASALAEVRHMPTWHGAEQITALESLQPREHQLSGL